MVEVVGVVDRGDPLHASSSFLNERIPAQGQDAWASARFLFIRGIRNIFLSNIAALGYAIVCLKRPALVRASMSFDPVDALAGRPYE